MNRPSDVRKSLGAILEGWREREGLSKKEAARRIGVSARSYADYAAGRTMPRPGLLRRIIEATETDWYEFMPSERRDGLDEEIARLREELSKRFEELEAELRRLRPDEETPSASS